MKLPHEELPNLAIDEAEDLLRVHGGSCEDASDERMYSGMLFSLRSWNSPLDPENFHEVMACIKAIGPELSSEKVRSRPLSDLWAIYYLGSCYVADPNRQERRKEVLSEDELGIELQWLDCIGYAVMTYLQYDDARDAFDMYNAYVIERRRNEA